MKKFKLLQLYPSLPNDWKVGMEVGLGDRNYGYSPCAGNYTDYKKLDNPEVENNPEFWEEVIEKEYEILSFKCIVDHSSVADFNEIRVISENTATVKAYLEMGSCVKNGDWAINSVKRLSDCEVFSVGDTVKALTYPSSSFIVTHFSFTSDGEYICGKDRSCYLKYGVKLKQENEKKYSLNDMTKIANHWAFIKGQPNNDNTLKIIEKWKTE